MNNTLTIEIYDESKSKEINITKDVLEINNNKAIDTFCKKFNLNKLLGTILYFLIKSHIMKRIKSHNIPSFLLEKLAMYFTVNFVTKEVVNCIKKKLIRLHVTYILLWILYAIVIICFNTPIIINALLIYTLISFYLVIYAEIKCAVIEVI